MCPESLWLKSVMIAGMPMDATWAFPSLNGVGSFALVAQSFPIQGIQVEVAVGCMQLVWALWALKEHNLWSCWLCGLGGRWWVRGSIRTGIIEGGANE